MAFVSLPLFDSTSRRNLEEFNLARLGLALDLLHDRQRAVGSRTDHQPPAVPGNVLRGGKRRVAVGVAEGFGGLLLPFTNVPAVDDHVVLISHAVDLDGAELEPAEAHDLLHGMDSGSWRGPASAMRRSCLPSAGSGSARQADATVRSWRYTGHSKSPTLPRSDRAPPEALIEPVGRVEPL